jgi:hypothetical protein
VTAWQLVEQDSLSSELVACSFDVTFARLGQTPLGPGDFLGGFLEQAF